jgi:hypothetical protein
MYSITGVDTLLSIDGLADTFAELTDDQKSKTTIKDGNTILFKDGKDEKKVEITVNEFKALFPFTEFLKIWRSAKGQKILYKFA